MERLLSKGQQRFEVKKKLWNEINFFKLKKIAFPYVILSPALVIYSIFFFFPFLYALKLSFMQWNLISPDMEFVGLQNYKNLFIDKVFWISFKNTFVYVLGIVPISMIVGLGLAVLVESVGRLKEIYRFLLFMPVVVSWAVMSYVWIFIMNPSNGALNNLISLFGITGPNWLNDPKWAMASLIIIGIWKTAGYNMILYISGLKGINKQIYEAAEIDGAGKWKQFIKITLPLLAPINLFVLIMSIIGSFKVFEMINIMTQGGPNNSTNVLVYKVYQEAFQFFDIGRASALSMVIFVIVFVLTVVQIRMTQSKIYYQ